MTYPKIENLNESIMLLFFQFIRPTPFIIFYTFLGCIFFASRFISALTFSFVFCTFGCDDRCLALCWDWCVCLYPLRPHVRMSWLAPYLWDNSIKSLVLSPRPLKSCMNSIAWSSKICAFSTTLGPSLRQVFMEAATKYPASLILSRVDSTCRKHKKAPSIWKKSFSYVMHICS